MVYGVFGLGLVLGWSALFSRGSHWISAIAWLTLLSAMIVLAPNRSIAAAGIATGVIAHLLVQLGLEARRG